MAFQPIRLEMERSFPVRPDLLWEILANTDDLDRESGLPTVAFGPVVVSAEGFFRQASSRLFGKSLRWREYPFEWVRGERYAVLRAFEAGFLDTFYGGAEMTAKGEGANVRLFAEITPRTLIGSVLARQMGKKGLRDALAYCGRSVAHQREGLDVLPARAGRATPADQRRLDQLAQALRPSGPADLVARFIRHLAAAPDREVLQMRPYLLADRWGAERPQTLRLFVDASRRGALIMMWAILCPNCRVAGGRPTTLPDMGRRLHCDVCAIDYDADLAQNVELRYAVHPSIRAAKDETYCVGGPSNSPHVWVQQYLLPGTERTLTVALSDEAFRARVLRGNAICPLTPAPASGSEVSLTLQEEGWDQLRQKFSPGRVRIRLRNETARVAVAVIEQVGWDACAVTAAAVMREPEFRTLTPLSAGDRGQAPV